jgi:hypothetical protein
VLGLRGSPTGMLSPSALARARSLLLAFAEHQARKLGTRRAALRAQSPRRPLASSLLVRERDRGRAFAALIGCCRRADAVGVEITCSVCARNLHADRSRLRHSFESAIVVAAL